MKIIALMASAATLSLGVAVPRDIASHSAKLDPDTPAVKDPRIVLYGNKNCTSLVPSDYEFELHDGEDVSRVGDIPLFDTTKSVFVNPIRYGEENKTIEGYLRAFDEYNGTHCWGLHIGRVNGVDHVGRCVDLADEKEFLTGRRIRCLRLEPKQSEGEGSDSDDD